MSVVHAGRQTGPRAQELRGRFEDALLDSVRTQMRRRLSYLEPALSMLGVETEGMEQRADTISRLLLAGGDIAAQTAEEVCVLWVGINGLLEPEWWATPIGVACARAGLDDQPDEPWVSTVVAAKMSGLTPARIRKMREEGQLGTGGRNTVSRPDLLEWISYRSRTRFKTKHINEEAA